MQGIVNILMSIHVLWIFIIPWLCVLSYYDWRYFRLPNIFTLGGAACAALIVLIYDPRLFLPGLIWFALYCVAKPYGIGWGDIKFAIPLGLFLSLYTQGNIEAMIFALGFSALFTIFFFFYLRFFKKESSRKIAHGPAMSCGFICSVLLFL